MYPENYKTLLKENKDDTNGKACCVHELGDLMLFKCPYYPKWTTDSMKSLSKCQKFFVAIEKKNLKIHMESQITLHGQNNLEGEKRWKSHTSWFQNILQSNSNQNSIVWA